MNPATMNLPDAYPLGSLVVSAILVVLFSLHLSIIATEYHEWHDERAARALLLALILLIAAIGALTSAIGLVTETAQYGTVGMSLLRGALLVGGITLILMDRKVGHYGD